MRINTLSLKNYRNHTNLKISFEEKTTIILGPNGAGKTNILEAINLLATSKSPRAHYDREMINHTAPFAKVSAQISTDDTYELEMNIIKSELYQNTASKQVKINGVKKPLSKFAGILNTVIFLPTDTVFLLGQPASRRDYFDSVLYQISQDYQESAKTYAKAVRQRNKLLENIRETGKGKDLIEIWDDKIIKHGKIIQDFRQNFTEYVQKHLNQHFYKLDQNHKNIEFEYHQSEISQERVDKYKDKEIYAARTLIGPHRDDFEIKMEKFDVSSFGSRGQQRSVVLALKMCEIDFLASKNGVRPILLLDDIFSELDENHKQAVFEIVDLQQTIITSAEDVGSIKTHVQEIKL